MAPLLRSTHRRACWSSAASPPIPAADLDPLIPVLVLAVVRTASTSPCARVVKRSSDHAVVDSDSSTPRCWPTPSRSNRPIAPLAGVLLLASTSQAATAGSRPTVLATLLGAPFLAFAVVRYDVPDGLLLLTSYLVVAITVTVFVALIAGEERTGPARQGGAPRRHRRRGVGGPPVPLRRSGSVSGNTARDARLRQAKS